MRKLSILLLTTLLVFVTAISIINHDVSEVNGSSVADTTIPVISGATIHDTIKPTAIDMGKIVFCSNRDGNQEIYIMNVDGSNQTRLTKNSATDSNPKLSADGQKIVFDSDRDGNQEIYVMNVDGSNQTRLTNNILKDSHPAWSPDSTEIVFDSGSADVYDHDHQPQIWIMKSDGSNPIQLTHNNELVLPILPGAVFLHTAVEPDFSPDGTRIAFSSISGTTHDRCGIWTMNTDGSNKAELVHFGQMGHCGGEPDWSPDNTRITYFHYMLSSSCICISDGIDTNNITSCTSYSELYDNSPSYSPDGSKIAFCSNRKGNNEIYIMNADGSNQTRITNNAADDSFPSWGPTASSSPALPSPPTLVAPSNGATNLSTTSTFEWNAVSGADYYGLHIRDITSGEGPLVFDSEVDYGSITGTSFKLPSGYLRNGKTYRWDMRSHNTAGWGTTYSTNWIFSTTAGNNTIDTTLGDTINKRLQQRITYPPMFLNAKSFSEATTLLWTSFQDWIMQTDLKDKYFDAYNDGINYDSMRMGALMEALRSVNNGDVDRALTYLQKSEAYERASNLSFQAANDIFITEMEVAQAILQGIKDSCQATVKFGLIFVSPAAAKFADVFYDALDFGLDYYFSGIGEAGKNLTIKLAIDSVFNQVPFGQLGGKTLSDWVKNRTGALIFPELSKVVASEEFQWAISKAVKEAVNEAGQTVAESIVKDIVDAVVDKTQSMLSTVEVKLHSPGELRVYNSNRQVVGLVNGAIECQIPQSMYYDGTVTIFCPQDTYSYEVAGTDVGTYGLEVTWVLGRVTNTFNATDIPMASGVVHHYTVDWSALSNGEQGVTVGIDSDGNGTVDKTLIAGAKLTHDDFVSVTSKGGPPFSIWIAIGVGAAVILTVSILIWRRSTKKVRIIT